MYHRGSPARRRVARPRAHRRGRGGTAPPPPASSPHHPHNPTTHTRPPTTPPKQPQASPKATGGPARAIKHSLGRAGGAALGGPGVREEGKRGPGGAGGQADRPVPRAPPGHHPRGGH